LNFQNVFDNKGNLCENIWKMNKLGSDNETFSKIIRLLVLNFWNVFDNKGNRCENIWKMNKLGSDNENFP
jgi:hypothetical protein